MRVLQPAAEVRRSSRLPRDGWIVALLIVLAALIRIAWLTTDDLRPERSETHFMAQALAERGEFADAFGPGSGSTAHLAPTTPLITAGVYSLFGVGTPAAMAVLSLQSIAFVCTSFLLAFKAFEALGSPRAGRLAALAIVTLLPLQIALEVRSFRSWEGAIAASLIAGMLLWTLQLDKRQTIPTRTLIGLGLANGAIALINPAAGLASSGMIGVLLLRRVRFTRWPVPVLASIAILAAVSVPWAIHNQRTLGTPILTRASLGISMAISYHDGQFSKDRETAYRDRFREISPLRGGKAIAEYKRLGEVEYNRRLEADARSWLAAHPAEARRIQLENLRDFYFPPEWHLKSRIGAASRGTWPRMALMWVFSAVGLATLAAMLARRRWHYLYVAAAVLLPCLPYIFIFSLLRYRYIVSSLLIFLACDGAARLWRGWHERRLLAAS